MTTSNHIIEPWYKQGWPFFLIGLTLFGVISAGIMTYFAVSSPVAMVTNDYYKQGLGINRDISKYKNSMALGISAQVHFEKDQLIINLTKGQLTSYPTLSVVLQHRTLPDQDQHFMVNVNGQNQYKIALNKSLSGPWFIELDSFDKTWKLRHRLDLPMNDSLTISGLPDY